MTTHSGVRPRPFRFAVQAYRAPSGPAWRDLARRVEGLGYSSIQLSDHYLGPGPVMEAAGHRPVTLAPIPAMAVAAEVTTTLTVGCRLFCVGYHNPVVLAKEVATLAEFSAGRTEVGLGAGWLEGEFSAMGLPYPPAGERITLLAETIDLMRQHFSGEPVAMNGSQVTAHGFEPLPVPAAPPPLMIGGGAPRILRLAGRTADIVSVNFNNRAGTLGADGIGTSGEDETYAKLEWVADGAGDRYGDIELEIGAYFVAVDGAEGPSRDDLCRQLGMSRDQLARFPHALAGSVDEICESLVERREKFGFSYITVGDRVIDAFAPVVDALAGR